MATGLSVVELQEQISALKAQREKLRARLVLDGFRADARAKADQQTLIDKHGGRQAVLDRGTFINSPVPGETPRFTAESKD